MFSIFIVWASKKEQAEKSTSPIQLPIAIAVFYTTRKIEFMIIPVNWAEFGPKQPGAGTSGFKQGSDLKVEVKTEDLIQKLKN